MRSTTKRRRWSVIPLALTLSVAACEPAAEDAADEAEDVAEERAEVGGADTVGMADTAAAGAATAEEDIRRRIDEWLAAIEARDTAAIGRVYTEEGRLMPPGRAAVAGRDSVVALWGQMLADPNVQLTFTPAEIRVAEGGEMAYDVGTYRLTLPDGAEDRGKYLVVWVREGGQWRVAADMYNSDSPPPAVPGGPPGGPGAGGASDTAAGGT